MEETWAVAVKTDAVEVVVDHKTMIIVWFIHMDSINEEIAASTRAAENLRDPMTGAMAMVVAPVEAIKAEDTKAEATAMVHNSKIYIIKIRAISSSLNNRRMII